MQLLKRILEASAGEGVTVYRHTEELDLLLGELCIVVAYADKMDPDRVTLFLSTEDIRSEMENGVEFVLKQKATNPSLMEWEQLGIGLLNYYGVLPLKDFRQEMKRRTGVKSQSAEESALTTMIETNTAFTNLVFMLQDEKGIEPYIMSPLMEDVDHVLEERASRPDLKFDFSLPSNEMLMAYGQRPFVAPYLAQEKKLYDLLLKNVEKDAEKVDWMYNKVWHMVQSDKGVPEILSVLQPEFKTMNLLTDLMNAFMEFSNHVPKWILYGYTSHALFEKFEKPRLRSLSSTPFSPFGFPLSGMPFGGNQTSSQKKVGRNDPCPCGSGKKYKHCCGK